MTEDDARAQLQANVSRETLERLDIYADLLRKWQPAINLVAPSTLQHLFLRHFLDSAQLTHHVQDQPLTWLDLGSGAGFPGAVCAVVLHDKQPDTTVKLVESDQRKSAFLREVARQTAVLFEVMPARIESLAPQQADVISARALAPLPKLLSLAFPHLKTNGTCLFQKGASHQDELASAAAHWHMDVKIHPSVTSQDAVTLELRGLRNASPT
ncbi:MAG: 16S rRNA (guanine(527)-N(7))-methyltransferase RsmG [Pseudomonadota bacterium]